MRSLFILAVLGLTLSGCGGGGGGTAATTPTPPAQSAAPTLLQTQTFQTVLDAFATDPSVQFPLATRAGNAIWVAVTLSDFNHIHTITVSDTQGNAYTLLDQQDDGLPGTQTVAHFYAANIHGDITSADTITVTAGSENYQGVLIAEISGVTQAPLVGHAANIQDGLPQGTNNVSSGAIQVGATQAPALLLALSMNTSGGMSDTGGSTFPGPAAGMGLTPFSVLWNWGTTLATFGTATVTGAESVTGLFSAPSTDSYVTVAAVFH